MGDQPFRLSIAGQSGPGAPPTGAAPIARLVSGSHAERPWIGVHFLCAGQYVRVHRSPDASHYLARCPRCARTTRFRVGPGGTDHRFFEVSC